MYSELLHSFFAWDWAPQVFSVFGVIFSIIFGVAIYVYVAMAWSTIARKMKYGKHWLAWIPLANLFLIPILAKKRWEWGFIFLVPLVNLAFFIIWTWKIFEMRKFPGWFSLSVLIPKAGSILYLVAIGFVAWYRKK
jgi:hypothetical protein